MISGIHSCQTFIFKVHNGVESINIDFVKAQIEALMHLGCSKALRRASLDIFERQWLLYRSRDVTLPPQSCETKLREAQPTFVVAMPDGRVCVSDSCEQINGQSDRSPARILILSREGAQRRVRAKIGLRQTPGRRRGPLAHRAQTRPKKQDRCTGRFFLY